MKFFENYKKQILTVLAVVLVAASILTAGRTGNANFLESTLGFVITPLQKVTTNVSSFFGDKFSNIKNEKEQIKLENEKLVEKMKKIAVEGVMRSKNCRNVKALSALVDMDSVHVDDEGNISGIDIEKLMEEYPYLFEKEKSKRYGNGFKKSGKSESSVEKNFKKGLFRV